MEIMPLSAGERKIIRSMQLAKNRRASGLFVAEGAKCVSELLDDFSCHLLAATPQWLDSNRHRLSRCSTVLRSATRSDLERASGLQSPPEVIALLSMHESTFDPADARNQLIVALDGVQDPGNLGTIIRTCNWFGVSKIICSMDTVDVYNPKVVQSTMGGLSRVKVVKLDLAQTLKSMSGEVPIYGTFLDGEDLNKFSAESASGVIVMGNEGKGISPEVASTINRRLFIPPYPRDNAHVESLNVAIATAIILSAFRR